MQAIALIENGGPEVVKIREHPDPTPGPGEVLVELRAAALNRRDTLVRAGVYEGETVAVLGAGSGVSTISVQLAAQAGARVFVTSSEQEKIDRAIGFGAEAGVNYLYDGWVDELRALTGGAGVNVVVDSVGSTWPDSLAALSPGGRVVCFGATGGTEAQLQVRPFYFGQASLLGTTMGSPREFKALLEMIATGSWAPVIDSVRPLADAAEAHARLEAGAHFGKLVFDV
jgi:zinc-binding alcohol dehydrogenase/oxidoreductase